MIVWAITTGGKRAPFVLDPNGAWIIERGNAIAFKPLPPQLELGALVLHVIADRYTSHFADCPNANEHRKARS